MAEITKIERLDGKNYQSRKYNIKNGLMEVVYGDLLKEQKLLLVLVWQPQCEMRTVLVRTKPIL